MFLCVTLKGLAADLTHDLTLIHHTKLITTVVYNCVWFWKEVSNLLTLRTRRHLRRQEGYDERCIMGNVGSGVLGACSLIGNSTRTRASFLSDLVH